MAASLTPGARSVMAASWTPKSSYEHAWAGIAPGMGFEKSWYRTPKGKWRAHRGGIGLELDVKFDPNFYAFLSRLDKMPGFVKKEFRDALRKVAREEILPVLRRNIPESPKRKRHLRATAKIMEVGMDKVIIGVGSDDRWYAAVVHAGGSNRTRRRRPYTGKTTGTARPIPFMTETFREVWKPVNQRFTKEVGRVIHYVTTGKRRRFLG